MMYDLDEEFEVDSGAEWIIDNLSLSHCSSHNWFNHYGLC